MAALSGYLEMLKEDGGDVWERHWVTIEGPTLNWYTNERRNHKIGTFQLNSLHKIQRQPDGLSEFHKVFLYNADRDLTIRARTIHELEMWIRAIELYADLARGGDGHGIISVPVPAGTRRRRHQSSGDLDDSEEKTVESNSIRESSKGVVYHVDRLEAKDFGNTVVRHVSEEEEVDFDADAKMDDRFEDGSRRISAKCRLAAHPFTFRAEAESDKIGSFTEYDDSHHLVTRHNVDTGVTTFNADGTMHTNFYF